MKCPKCGAEYDSSFRFCPQCAEANPLIERKPVQVPAQPTAPAGVARPPGLPVPPAHPTKPPMVQEPPLYKVPPTHLKPSLIERLKEWLSVHKKILLGVAAAVVVVAVVLGVLFGVVLKPSAEEQAAAVAKEFVEDAWSGNYADAWDMVDTEGYPYLGLIRCDVYEQTADSFELKDDNETIDEFYSGDEGFLEGLTSDSDFTESGKDVESCETYVVSDDEILVALDYEDGSATLPIPVIKTGDGWKVDMVGLCMFGATTVDYAKTTAEGLLEKPTKEKAQKAVDLIEACKGLDAKLGIWLNTDFKEELNSQAVKTIEAALETVSDIDSLYEKASKLASGETKLPEDFISVDLNEGQQLNVGSCTITGTAEEGCASITLNGQPVGVVPETGQFAQPFEVGEGSNTLVFEITDEDGLVYQKTVSVTGVITPEQYKATCPPGPPFANLDKNPDSYKGQRCQYTGKIVQVMESAGTTDIRMNVTPGSYGFWSDTVYVTFEGTTPAVEDSIIVVYGEIDGSYTYTSQAGYRITLPLIKAKYIDVQ